MKGQVLPSRLENKLRNVRDITGITLLVIRVKNRGE